MSRNISTIVAYVCTSLLSLSYDRTHLLLSYRTFGRSYYRTVKRSQYFFKSDFCKELDGQIFIRWTIWTHFIPIFWMILFTNKVNLSTKVRKNSRMMVYRLYSWCDEETRRHKAADIFFSKLLKNPSQIKMKEFRESCDKSTNHHALSTGFLRETTSNILRNQGSRRWPH